MSRVKILKVVWIFELLPLRTPVLRDEPNAFGD